MSNVDRAAKVIDQWTQEGYELNSAVGSPHAIAERLAKAGLLMPEPPEPDALDRKGWPHWDIHGYGDHNDTVHVTYLAGDVFINSPACNMSARPEEAATLARVVHAAAYYPKGWTQA